MTDTKDLKRLNASADFQNHPDGYLVLLVKDGSGGEFDLHPKISTDAVYLPSAEAPAYRVAVMGETPDVLDRFGKALQTLARHQREANGEGTNDSRVLGENLEVDSE